MPPTRKGTSKRTQLSSPDMYRLRAMQILKLRIQGMSIGDLATHFNCHVDTIRRSINWAEREGLVQQYESEIISKLVPAAITVYETKLADSDDPDAMYAARDVLQMVMKLGDRFQLRETENEKRGLQQYLTEKRLAAVASKSGGDVGGDQPPPVELLTDPATGAPVLSAGYLGELSPTAPADAAATPPVDPLDGEDGILDTLSSVDADWGEAAAKPVDPV